MSARGGDGAVREGGTRVCAHRRGWSGSGRDAPPRRRRRTRRRVRRFRRRPSAPCRRRRRRRPAGEGVTRGGGRGRGSVRSIERVASGDDGRCSHPRREGRGRPVSDGSKADERARAGRGSARTLATFPSMADMSLAREPDAAARAFCPSRGERQRNKRLVRPGRRRLELSSASSRSSR